MTKKSIVAIVESIVARHNVHMAYIATRLRSCTQQGWTVIWLSGRLANCSNHSICVVSVTVLFQVPLWNTIRFSV